MKELRPRGVGTGVPYVQDEDSMRLLFRNRVSELTIRRHRATRARKTNTLSDKIEGISWPQGTLNVKR